MTNKVRILLDSGAFSAWNQNDEIDLKSYMAFVKQNKSALHWYVNLDVIPRPGISKEKAAELSYANLLRMRDAGLDPMPVYHFGENHKWLELLLKEGYRYIGIGGMVPIRLEMKSRWLDNVFTILTDSKGRPLVKTHGFGISNLPATLRYPWTSVDSTAWMRCPGYGLIPVPLRKGSTWDYLVTPRLIKMSTVGKNAAVRSYTGLSNAEQAVVQAWLDHCGLDLVWTCVHDKPRRHVFLRYYRDLVDALKINEIRFTDRTPSFRQITLPKLAPLKWEGMVIYHQVGIDDKDFCTELSETGHNDRLLTYYEARGEAAGSLAELAKRGVVGVYTRKTTFKTNWRSRSKNPYITHRRRKLIERHKDYSKLDEEGCLT